MKIEPYAIKFIMEKDIDNVFSLYSNGANPNDTEKIAFIGEIILYTYDKLLSTMIGHEEEPIIGYILNELYDMNKRTIISTENRLRFLINFVSNPNYDKDFFCEEILRFDSAILDFILIILRSFISCSQLPENQLATTLLILHGELSKFVPIKKIRYNRELTKIAPIQKIRYI